MGFTTIFFPCPKDLKFLRYWETKNYMQYICKKVYNLLESLHNIATRINEVGETQGSEYLTSCMDLCHTASKPNSSHVTQRGAVTSCGAHAWRKTDGGRHGAIMTLIYHMTVSSSLIRFHAASTISAFTTSLQAFGRASNPEC